MYNKLAITLTMFAIFLGISCSAMAQNKNLPAKGKRSLADLVAMAKEGKPAANAETSRIVREAYAEKGSGEEQLLGYELTGTWNCHIPESDAGNAPFEALQTFSADGTFVETSSLLATGTEGPAHGAWERTFRGYLLTFELFVFDPETRESVGRVRVRNYIRVNTHNTFTSYNVVDFIEPDGNVIEGIDGGIFTASRLQVRGI